MNDKSMTYNYTVVRQFSIMTVVWGIVGMTVGVLIAAQMAWPVLNFDTPWLTFGRLRPLHTNAVVFAFGGSALFATSYYVVQRTCHTRLFAPALAQFTFWGWQLVILLAAITLPLGYTSSKEYAELEWPIDLSDYRGLGVLCRGVLRYHCQAQDQAYLCRQLVLRFIYSYRRDVARGQQCGAAGVAC